MGSLKIGTKLLIGFGLGSLLLIICAITGMVALSSGARELVDVQAVNEVSSDVSSIITYAASISDGIKALALTDDPAERQKALDGIGELRKSYKEKLDRIAANSRTPEGNELLGKLKAALATGKVSNQKMIEAAMKGDRPGFIEIYKNEGKFALAKVSEAGKELNSYYSNLSAARAEQALNSSKHGKVMLILLSTLAFFASFVIAALFSASITRPIRACVKIADRISDGDLTVVIESNGNDETALLMRAMQNMATRMKLTLSALSSASREVSSAAADLHRSSNQMVAGADEVALSPIRWLPRGKRWPSPPPR